MEEGEIKQKCRNIATRDIAKSHIFPEWVAYNMGRQLVLKVLLLMERHIAWRVDTDVS